LTPQKLRSVADEIAASLGWSVLEFAGSGSFKETYLAVTESNEKVALKVFDPACCDLARAERELNAMEQCESSRVAALRLWGVYETGNGQHVYAAEEFFEDGTLTDRLAAGVLPAREVRNLGTTLAEALAEIEPKGLVHRDIKPDNIMFRLDDPRAVLVDFGLVRDTTRSSLTPTFLPSGPGTPLFASPEQLNNDKLLIDWRTDQFCLGVVLAVSLTGHHPFWREGMTDGQVVDAVASRNRCSDEFAGTAQNEGLSLVCRMLEPWPIKRYSQPAALVSALAEEGAK